MILDRWIRFVCDLHEVCFLDELVNTDLGTWILEAPRRNT
jgi:hypothetical protein